jgi:hypothetical protein
MANDGTQMANRGLNHAMSNNGTRMMNGCLILVMVNHDARMEAWSDSELWSIINSEWRIGCIIRAMVNHGTQWQVWCWIQAMVNHGTRMAIANGCLLWAMANYDTRMANGYLIRTMAYHCAWTQNGEVHNLSWFKFFGLRWMGHMQGWVFIVDSELECGLTMESIHLKAWGRVRQASPESDLELFQFLEVMWGLRLVWI